MGLRDIDLSQVSVRDKHGIIGIDKLVNELMAEKLNGLEFKILFTL